jgi:uncharacterized protein
MRFVFDTNVIVSAALLPTSTPAQALMKAEHMGVLLYSDATLEELINVLERPKLKPYIKPDYIKEFYARVRINWEHIPIIQRIAACRDSKDDKFLEVAINGSASTLISGDNDLLTLNPYNKLNIVTPAEFLK